MNKTTNKYSDFPLIDRAIAALDWDSATLTELDNLINDIENGRKHFKRFPLAAANGFRQGGRANEAASLLLATGKSTNCEMVKHIPKLLATIECIKSAPSL